MRLARVVRLKLPGLTPGNGKISGLRPTVNGETPRRRSNRRPMPPRDEQTVPAQHPPAQPSKGRAEMRSGSPRGVIASESGLTARLPRGTGSSVAQERRFDLRTGEKPSARLQRLLEARNRRKRAPTISGPGSFDVGRRHLAGRARST